MGKHTRQERADKAEAKAVAAELEKHAKATRVAEGLARRDELLRERREREG